MLQLIHMPFSPFSRKVRLTLAEKRMEAEMVEQLPWEMGDDLYDLNPAGTLPVLIDGETVIADSVAICEYLEDTHPDPALMPREAVPRAEVRRLVAWFDQKFQREVTELVLYEKVHRKLKGQGYPDVAPIRAGLMNLRNHLDYIGFLVTRRNWLAGKDLSLADFAAASHLSCLDYVGDVPWSNYPETKDWYVRVKSRPAFRDILEDRIRGMPPPRHYADLDF